VNSLFIGSCSFLKPLYNLSMNTYKDPLSFLASEGANLMEQKPMNFQTTSRSTCCSKAKRPEKERPSLISRRLGNIRLLISVMPADRR
jgi:hypothetical protein